MNDLYHEQLLEEARHPQHAGQLAAAELVLTGTNASCGDEVTIYLKFETFGDPLSPIIVLTWLGRGCVISQAAMSALARLINQRKVTLNELQKMTQNELEELLGLTEISLGRVKCLLLGLKTLTTSTYL